MNGYGLSGPPPPQQKVLVWAFEFRTELLGHPWGHRLWVSQRQRRQEGPKSSWMVALSPDGPQPGFQVLPGRFSSLKPGQARSTAESLPPSAPLHTAGLPALAATQVRRHGRRLLLCPSTGFEHLCPPRPRPLLSLLLASPQLQDTISNLRLKPPRGHGLSPAFATWLLSHPNFGQELHTVPLLLTLLCHLRSPQTPVAGPHGTP